MNKIRLTGYLAAASVILAGGGLPVHPQAQTSPTAPGATVAYTTEARATVESVDQASREVVLRGAGGAVLAVKAGPEVRNLQQIHVGDQVVIRYVEALAARLAPADASGSSTVDTQGGIARSSPGTPPSAVARDQVRATVQVEAVDRAANMVTVTGPSGAVRTVAVRDPEAQRFLQTLKPGDRVELTYTESLAIAVEPAQR